MLPKSYTTHRPHGEYSTIEIPSVDGIVIETVWFPDDETVRSIVVGRTYLGLRDIAAQHIKDFESGE